MTREPADENLFKTTGGFHFPIFSVGFGRLALILKGEENTF